MVEISYRGFCALGALRNPKLSRREYHGKDRYYYRPWDEPGDDMWLAKGPGLPKVKGFIS